jgi:anti-sigma regulatory factor (Ser/Thr protein kinase)
MTYNGISSCPPASDGHLTLDLPREPTCAALARQFLRAHLSDDMGETALERALLVASELTTNALKHGKGAIELRLLLDEDHVRIEVVDEGTGAKPQIRGAAGDTSGGWGLRIVDEVALRWGSFEGTTHVWADVSCSA